MIDFVDGDGELQKLSSYDKNTRATAVLKEKHVYTLVKVEGEILWHYHMVVGFEVI